MKGNCCAARARSVDLMVTTAGETLAHKVSIRSLHTRDFALAGAGAAGWLDAKPIICSDRCRGERKNNQNRLKKMFTVKLFLYKYSHSYLQCLMQKIREGLIQRSAVPFPATKPRLDYPCDILRQFKTP